MDNITDILKLLVSLRSIAVELQSIAPELRALADNLEAAVQGRTGGTVRLGEAAEAVIRKLRH